MPKPITTVEPKVTPDPKLGKCTRRVFTVVYDLSIIQQADACKHGELDALLRRDFTKLTNSSNKILIVFFHIKFFFNSISCSYFLI